MADEKVPFVSINGCNKVIYLRDGVGAHWVSELPPVEDGDVPDYYIITSDGTQNGTITGVYQFNGENYVQVTGVGNFVRDNNVEITEDNAFVTAGSDQKELNTELIEAILNNLNTINTLNNEVNVLQGVLLSNDFSLDTLQELVDFIKENRTNIEALQAVQVGVTTDDKVELISQYISGITNQSDYNIALLDKISVLENAQNARFTTTVTTSGAVQHDLNTYDLQMECYDISTKYTVDKRYYRIDPNRVEIEFDTAPVNPIKVIIRPI